MGHGLNDGPSVGAHHERTAGVAKVKVTMRVVSGRPVNAEFGNVRLEINSIHRILDKPLVQK